VPVVHTDGEIPTAVHVAGTRAAVEAVGAGQSPTCRPVPTLP